MTGTENGHATQSTPLATRIRRRWPVRPESEVEHYAACARVRDVVGAWYGLTPEQMLSDQRGFAFSHPRQVAMYLCTKVTKYSLPRIGSAFRRDHTTVMHAVKAVQDRVAYSADYKAEIEQLQKRLTEPAIVATENVVNEAIELQAQDIEAMARRAFARDPERTVAAVLAAVKAIAGAGVLALLASPAIAVECAPHDDVLKTLAEKFAQRPAGGGLSRHGLVLELLQAPGGATWTLVAVLPDGTACLLDAGEGWQAIEGEPCSDRTKEECL